MVGEATRRLREAHRIPRRARAGKAPWELTTVMAHSSGLLAPSSKRCNASSRSPRPLRCGLKVTCPEKLESCSTPNRCNIARINRFHIVIANSGIQSPGSRRAALEKYPPDARESSAMRARRNVVLPLPLSRCSMGCLVALTNTTRVWHRRQGASDLRGLLSFTSPPESSRFASVSSR